MLRFEPPAHTRYDLHFTLAGIPVCVHPLFWLMTILFGASSGDLIQLLVWVAVVFVSILIHEMGHALMMRWYGRPSRVVLYLAGGLTVPEAVGWGNRWASVSLGMGQEIAISLAGPGAGFLLAALVLAGVAAAGGSVGVSMFLWVIPLPTAMLPTGGGLLNSIISTLLWVNIFWGLINLMPVFPLDGGNVARHLLVMADPLDGLRTSLWVSVIAGATIAAVGLLLLNSLYVAFLFGVLAFQSYQALRGRIGVGY